MNYKKILILLIIWIICLFISLVLLIKDLNVKLDRYDVLTIIMIIVGIKIITEIRKK